jgi:hypothetical protein
VTTDRKSRVTFLGDGSQKIFVFGFEYLRQAFIQVYLNGTLLVQGVDYTVTDAQVEFTLPPALGSKIDIFRLTSSQRLLTWSDATVFRAEDLTISEVQTLHLTEEEADRAITAENYLQEQIDILVNPVEFLEELEEIKVDCLLSQQEAETAAGVATGAAAGAGISEINAAGSATAAGISELIASNYLSEMQALSASPKGVYTYLSDLQTAYPTGNNNIYIVSGNVAEVETLTVTGGCTTNGNASITLNGVLTNVALTTAQNTATLVATAIRAGTFTGWTTGGAGATVTFTKNEIGACTAPVYSAGTTGASGTIAVTTKGADVDGGWYFWDSAWIRGGNYLSTGFADKAITQKQIADDTLAQLITQNPNATILLQSYVLGVVTGSTGVINTAFYAAVTQFNFINGKDLLLSFDDTLYKVRVRKYFADGSNTSAETTKSNYLIPYDNTITKMLVEVWKQGDAWGTVYTQNLVTTVAADFRIYSLDGQKVRIIPAAVNGYIADVNAGANEGLQTNHDINWETVALTLRKGDIIEFTVSTVKNANVLGKYDASWNYLKAIYAVTNPGYVTTTYRYIVKDDVEYLKLTHACVNGPLYLYKFIKDSSITSSPLYGKKITFIGDSYVKNNTHPVEETWHYKLAEKYHMTYVNKGINGDGLIGIRSGLTPVVTRLSTDVDTDSDYIVVIGGENDYNISLPLADFNAGLDQLIFGSLLGIYAGNGAKICFFVPWNRQGTNNALDAYTQAIISKCQYYGVPVFDSKDAGLYPGLNSSYRQRFFQGANDTSHLSEVGHNHFFTKAEDFLLKL